MGAIVLGLGVAAALLVAVGVLYNRLIRLRNGCRTAWSDIDVQLKRRHDLIPNLVETARGYASHEQRVLREVTEARGQARGAQGPAAQAGAESALGQAIVHFFAVVEAYPELRASDGFLKLQSELSDVEDGIENARRYYNAIVRDLNTACESIPSNFVAAAFRIRQRPYFRLDVPEERLAPQVELDR